MIEVSFIAERTNSKNLNEIFGTFPQESYASFERAKAEKGIATQNELLPVIMGVTNTSLSDTMTVSIDLFLKMIWKKDDSQSIVMKFPGFTILPNQEISMLLFDIAGCDQVLIDSVQISYERSGEERTIRQGSKWIISETILRGNYNGFSSEKEMETYLLLKNYLENGQTSRSLLFDLSLETLQKVSKDKIIDAAGVKLALTDDNLLRVRGILQVDIIGRLMMYIEDLLVICESMRTTQGNFYDILESEKDLGDVIRDFILQIEEFTDDDYRKILSYLDPKEIPDNAGRMIIGRLIQNNINSFKRFFDELLKFSKAHHPIFKRYKHAGIPIRQNPAALNVSSKTLSKFDSAVVVFTGKNPLKDISLLPYSTHVIEEYKKLSDELEKWMFNMVENRVSCIERNIPGTIPLEAYGTFNLEPFEREIMESVLLQHYGKYPIIVRRSVFTPNAIIKKQEFEWYENLE